MAGSQTSALARQEGAMNHRAAPTRRRKIRKLEERNRWSDAEDPGRCCFSSRGRQECSAIASIGAAARRGDEGRRGNASSKSLVRLAAESRLQEALRMPQPSAQSVAYCSSVPFLRKSNSGCGTGRDRDQGSTRATDTDEEPPRRNAPECDWTWRGPDDLLGTSDVLNGSAERAADYYREADPTAGCITRGLGAEILCSELIQDYV